jgi:hypothetical protein
MSDYAKSIRAKGWTQKDLAERWGITPRRLRQIAAAPAQWDWDALNGVPDRGV